MRMMRGGKPPLFLYFF